MFIYNNNLFPKPLIEKNFYRIYFERQRDRIFTSIFTGYRFQQTIIHLPSKKDENTRRLPNEGSWLYESHRQLRVGPRAVRYVIWYSLSSFVKLIIITFFFFFLCQIYTYMHTTRINLLWFRSSSCMFQSTIDDFINEVSLTNILFYSVVNSTYICLNI